MQVESRRKINATIENKKTVKKRAPDNPDSRDYFNGLHKAGAPKRTDITTWFDVLDMDDFVTFGGNP